MSDAETMAAFGASDQACYLWPGDGVDDRLCRAAFCAGAGWSAAEFGRLREARDADIERMNRALSKADYEAERAGNLENEIERLRAALEPFAAIGRRLNAVDEGAWPSDAKARFLNLDSINVGHFRQAGRVIEQTTKDR